MKAISIKQPFVGWILEGKKTLEIRSWPTKIRGDILICSSKLPKIGTNPLGHALAIVEMADCIEFLPEHETFACCKYDDDYFEFAWVFKNVRLIKPFPVKGKLGFYEVPLQPALQIYAHQYIGYQSAISSPA